MIPGHPHTVGAHPVPLYMRGLGAIEWHLGDDSGILFSDVQTPIDTTMYDPSGDLIPPSFASDYGGSGISLLPGIPAVTPIDPSMYDPTGGLVAPVSNLSAQDQALATLYKNSVAAGTMTAAQASSAIAQLMTTGAAAAKGLTTAPSPRVSVPAVATAPNPLTAATVIPGVPNFVLLLAAAGAAFAMGSR
jgi:hypothetical protein